jgi:PST family polysaccharide transporter
MTPRVRDEVTSDPLGDVETATTDVMTTTSRLLDSGADLVPEGELPEVPRDLTKSAARGFVLTLAGFIFLQLASFATYVVAGHYLSTSELGVVGKFLTVVFWMDVLLDMGMGAAIIRDQEKGQTERVGIAFSVNTIVAIIVSIGLYFAAPLIAGFFGVSDRVGLFQMLALLALFRGLGQVPNSMLERDMKFGTMATLGAARSTLRLGIALYMLAHGAGAAAMAVSVVVAEIVFTILAAFLAHFRPIFKWNRAEALEMMQFGFSIFGARLTGMLWLNGDYLVIGAKLSNADYGNYFTAFRLPELLLGSVYNMFSTVAYPTYSAARKLGDEKLREAYLQALKLLCLFGFPVGMGMSLIARDFITVVFPTHTGAILPMEILSIAGMWVAVGYASGDLYNAINKPRLGLYFNLMGTPILIGGFLYFVHDGIAAIALVHLCVIVPYSFFRMEVANRLIGTTWPQHMRALLPAVVTTIGILVFALPLRLILTPGLASMLATIAAGALGAFLGLLIGDRHAFGELREIAMKALKR